MQAVQELQFAVTRLSADELALFREWFDEFDAKESKCNQKNHSNEYENHSGGMA
jgi:hypothetical protein